MTSINKTASIISVILLLLFLAAGAVFFFLKIFPLMLRPASIDNETLAGKIAQIIRQPKVRSPLTNLLKNPDELDNRFYAVVVDNHVFGRSYQYGLSAASIFYEALAEGEITRLMAVFDGPVLSKVGPVRSLRPYFLDFAEQYKPVMIHVGGSSAALTNVARSNAFFDVDAMQYEGVGTYFSRDKKIAMPHNEFADLKEISKLAAEKNFAPDSSSGFFEFDAKAPENGKSAQEITIDFSDFSQYEAKFSYDADLKTYKRFIGGRPHIDQASKSQMLADNVLVVFTDYYPIDSEGRLEMKTVRAGDAMLIRDGRVSEGAWKRDKGGALIFSSADKKPFKLKPGVTWIEIVNEESRVKVK